MSTQRINDIDAYSIRTFVDRHEISRACLYDLWAQGLGPARMRVGKRVLISREAAAEWRRRMEAETAATLAQ